MAEPTTLPEIKSDAPAPAPISSTRPAAKPLSPADLKAELTSKVRESAAPKTAEPAPAKPAPTAVETKLPQLNFKDALRKQVLEKKPEPEKVVEKKEVVSADDALPPEKPATVSDEVPEDERKVLPHDKPATAKRINYFLKEIETLRKEKEAALAAAKANPTASNVEEYNKLKDDFGKTSDELLKYRRRYEVESDPEFASRYDKPAAETETAIEDTMKRYSITDGTLKAIKDEGGFAAFSRSKKTFVIPAVDADGTKGQEEITAAEYARRLLNSLPIADAEFIKQSIGKQQLLGQEKKSAITKAVDESKKYFEERDNQTKAQREAAQKDSETKAKEYNDWLKSTNESTDWLKDKSAPDNATEAQKKEVTEYNEFTKQLRDQMVKHPTNAKEYGAIMLDAAHAHHLRRESGTKDARIKALEAEVSKLKAGSRTTPKAGSLLTAKDAPEEKKEVNMDDPTKSVLSNMRSRVKGRGIEEE